MSMLEKIILLVTALAFIGFGIRTIIRREDSSPFSPFDRADDGGYEGDGDDKPATGFWAVLIGLAEIAVGIYLLIYREWPW